MADSHSTPAATDISSAILSAPGWARVGITMPDERMRVRAAAAMAEAILESIAGQRARPDPNQLPLAL